MTEAVREILRRRVLADPNGHIFTDSHGKKIKEVTNSFDKVVDEIGFNEGVEDRRNRIVFHTLRHTFASWLAIQGTPLYTISKLMGHKTILMTQRYSHLSPGAGKEAVNGLEAVFNSSKISTKKQKGEKP